MKEDCGLDYLPENVVVASGAKHVVYLALHAILNPEDEVIIPAPEWVSYVEMVRLAFGRPVLVYTTEQSDFKLTAAALEAAITDRTKCLILNSPCNPTGMVYSAAELAEIARVCQKYDLYVIADEIYYNLLYDNRSFVSFASLNEDAKNRTILVNGVSKSYAMTGWRVGYSLAGTEISGIMSRYVSHSTAAPSTISQWAAVAALTGPQDSREEMRKAFEQRRNYIVERVNAIPGVSCLKPQGAFYIMMNLSRLIGKHLYGVEITDGNVFAKLLLEKGLVAVVPGSAFDAPDYVRWSYAAGIDTIRVGMDRLEAFLKNA